MKAAIRGLGQWLPSQVRHNDAWPSQFVAEAAARGDRTLRDIPVADGDLAAVVTARYLRKTAEDPFVGAEERRVAPESIRSWDAEARAARVALADAGVEPAEVGAVLSWSIVPDRVAHATAPRVAAEIGAEGAFATSVDAGCASALVQLELAIGLVEAGRAQHVLLTQSHLITRAFPLAHPASPGVGDCATAVVVSASEEPGVLGVHAITHGQYWDAVTWIRGRDEDTDTPWWSSGPDFVPGSRDADGAKTLMRDTIAFGARTVREACERFRVETSEIAVLASVQPRAWTPSAIAEVLGVETSRAPHTYDRLAHVGGCGVITNLIEARDRGLLQPGALVALYAQGAGFTRSAALLRWSEE